MPMKSRQVVPVRNSLAPSLTDATAAANNAKSSVALDGNTITVTADVDELEESESSAPGQGIHRWLGLEIGTGLSSVTLVKYNGTSLTSDDASEAATVGLNQAGEFVLYIRAEEVAVTPKVIKLKADAFAGMLLLRVLIFVLGWLFLWQKTGAPDLSEMTKFIGEVTSASFIAAIGFFGKALVDRDKDGVPDEFEK